MIFLIRYRRSAGQLIDVTQFTDAERDEAHAARLRLELDLMNQRDGDEVCLLEADNLEALKKTHRRYFESLPTLTASGSSSVLKTGARKA